MFFLGFGLRSTGKVVLQRVRLNSGFCELVRSPRSRCESLDAVALAFSGVTDGAQRGRLASPSYSLRCRNLIAAAQNLLYCSMLTTAEMWVVLFDLVAGFAADQRRILVLARPHHADVATLQGDHLVGGEAPSDGSVRFPLNQPAVLDFLIELLLNPPKRDLAHCPFQRIPHQLTFFHNGFAFKVLFDCIMDGLADCSVYLLLAPRLNLVSTGLGFLHDTLRLVPEFLGHRLVTALHFFVADIDLGVPRSVGGDFCGFGPTDTLLVQVLFDLLPAWAAGFQILLGVALDLRCSVWALLNFISQLFQAQREFRSINGSRILLGAIQLMRLQSTGIAVFSLGDVEDDHMGVKLGGGISVYGTATVMLKFRGSPSASCFGLMVPTNARLNVAFQLVKRHADRFAVGHAHAFISAH